MFINKISKRLMASALFGVLSAHANAMQLTIKLADDIINSHDKISMAYNVYFDVSGTSQQNMSQDIKGVSQENLGRLLNHINGILAAVNPVNSMDGKNSTVTISYRHENNDTTPASCKSIIAKPQMEILFSQQGCTLM